MNALQIFLNNLAGGGLRPFTTVAFNNQRQANQRTSEQIARQRLLGMFDRNDIARGNLNETIRHRSVVEPISAKNADTASRNADNEAAKVDATKDWRSGYDRRKKLDALFSILAKMNMDPVAAASVVDQLMAEGPQAAIHQGATEQPGVRQRKVQERGAIAGAETLAREQVRQKFPTSYQRNMPYRLLERDLGEESNRERINAIYDKDMPTGNNPFREANRELQFTPPELPPEEDLDESLRRMRQRALERIRGAVGSKTGFDLPSLLR